MAKRGLYGEERECWICHDTTVHKHHIYPGSGRRQVSDREGCWVYLCPAHHNLSDFGVHFDHELDAFFRSDCQRRWMRREGGTEDDFRSLFGASYI